MREPERPEYSYLRSSKRFPHIWCPGCGIGIFMNALIRVIDRLGYNKDEIALVSGIGCSGRLPVYVDFNTLHTTHGRALTFATGIKLANPRLKVITVMGDGDAIAIGGNHLIHAARRNVEITSFVINNQVYGMTGGQTSPTTPPETQTVTSPYGNLEPSFDISRVVEAAGAVFVGRTTVYHYRLMDQLIAKALKKRGFSLVEVVSQCPIYWRWQGLETPVDMMRWLKQNSVRVEQSREMTEEQLSGRIVIGTLVDREKPAYHEEYARLVREKTSTHLQNST